ncbi:hypothetical protein KY360_01160 [Candidatus Woesearchaeota archaeon]|nr:hypothetical protein [Candidatus Woesearchaeota archaeon]
MQRNLVSLRIAILAVILIFGSLVMLDLDITVDTDADITDESKVSSSSLGSKITAAAVARENALLMSILSTSDDGVGGIAGAEFSSDNTSLEIWDSTEMNISYVNSSTYFYANYTNVTSGVSINGTGTNCSINFNYTGTWSTPVNMTFNDTTLLYQYNETVTTRFGSYYNITCDGVALGYDILNLTDEVYISNYPPETPTEFKPVSGIFDYEINITCNGSSDLEGDNITYNVITNLTNETYQYELRVLTANLTNESVYSWNLTELPSQTISLRCRAYDAYNLSSYIERSWTIDRTPEFNSSNPVQNLTWLEDIVNSSINLSQHFYDIDGDDLNYTHVGAENISVSINNDTGIVSLTPNSNFYGNNSIIFYAWDEFGLNASSNNVTLEIINTPEVNLSSPVDNADGYYASTGIDFYLQVEDDFLIDNCSLYINGSLNQTKVDLSLNTSLMAYNDSGSANSYDSIANSVDHRKKTLNLSNGGFNGFRVYLKRTGSPGPLIVKINDYNLFNISASEVSTTGAWVNKIVTNNSILVEGINNITFQDVGYELFVKYFELAKDSNGAYLVRFTNNILSFNTTTLIKGDYSWNATCFNEESQSKWSAETWALTVNNSAPEAPTNIDPASGTFDNQINVSCSGSTDPDGDAVTYTVQYSEENTPSNWVNVFENDADGNDTLDTSSLNSGDKLRFRCYSNDGATNSPTYMPTSSFNIIIDHQGAPSAPTNLTCNNGLCSGQTFDDEINLNCSGSTDTDSDFNFTFDGYYFDFDTAQWREIASVVNESDYGNYTWDTTQIINQTISIRCYSDDGDNTPLGYYTASNVTISHTNTPTTPINFNYYTDYKYQVNITANGSTDPNDDSILYRVWAYYGGSWHNINDTLTNETVFLWNIASVSEQDVELKAQATDGTYYSDFITAPTLTISREPTIPTNLTPESGNYEYQINYSCSGSNNTQYFVYYIDAYYDGSWNGLSEAFPGILPVNDSDLAYNDTDYYSIVDSNFALWKSFAVNVTNGDYEFCVKGQGDGQFRLYWNCSSTDTDGSSCQSNSFTSLTGTEDTYCTDISLTRSGFKHLKIRSQPISGSYSNYFNHAYLVAKPFTWNVTDIQRQENVDLRCLASDDAGNSSWFNPAGTLSINRVPVFNASENLSFACNERKTYDISSWFYDTDNDFLNLSSTNSANIYASINETTNNITIWSSNRFSGWQTIDVTADDNISQTTQSINITFGSCPAISTPGDGGGGGGAEVAAILTAIAEEEAAALDDGDGDRDEEIPPPPPPPEEKKERDEVTEKIIEKRFSVKRNLIVGFGKSQITESIANFDLFALEEVRVRITIPKDLARTTDDITVVTPFTIIDRDPIIEFYLGAIEPYDKREIVYVINNELTEEDFKKIKVEVIPRELTEEERLRREREIEEKIRNTNKVIDIKREVEISEEEEKTTYTLDIEFKEESVLYNVSIFEEIPKCLVELIKEELIDSDFEFEIVSADPLIVWHFDKITKEQRIQYTIRQLTEEECANKAKAVALAQQIIMITQRYSPTRIVLSLIPVPIILFILIFFAKFGEEKLHEEEYLNKLTKFAKAEYKIGKTEAEVKSTLISHGHKKEEVDHALNLNARNRLQHWLVRLEIGIEEVILFFIIGLSVLDFLEILPGDLDFMKKIVSWIILGYLIYKVSPSNILFGHKSRCVDIGLISGYFMLIMKDLVNFVQLFDVTQEVYFLRDLFIFVNRYAFLFDRWMFVSGITLLILVTICIALRFEIKQPSLMALVHITGPMHRKREFVTRFIMAHLLIIGFFVVVFNLLTEWLAIAVDAPIITAAIFFYLFILIKHKGRFKPAELAYKIGNVGEKFYERFIELFHYKKTLLLGFAGMKILHQVTDIGNFLIPYVVGLTDPIYFGTLGVGHKAIFDLFNGHSLFAAETLGMSLSFKIVLAIGYSLNIIAMGILLTLPALLWYHMYKYRELPVSRVPIFRLKKQVIILFFMSMTVFLIAPAFKVGHIKEEGLVGVDVTTQSIAGFEQLPLLLVVAFVVGALSCLFCYSGLRKYLKRIVIVSALSFFAYYMWHYFANVVIYFVKKIILLLEVQPFITTYLIAFLFVNIVFYLTGFISYFVELFLRNELGFESLVEREWLGILAHHDMHHIHYSNVHDEIKHGQEVEALARFVEKEIVHSLNAVKTIEKLIHHSWSLELIGEAVNKSSVPAEYKKPMLSYIARRRKKIKPLIDYMAKYRDMMSIRSMLGNAIKAGWSAEDIRLAMKEL